MYDPLNNDKGKIVKKYSQESLQGKTALITGASAGIGQSTAFFLASQGANLNLVARRTEKLESLSKAILEENPNIKVDYLSMDINSPDCIGALQSKGFFESDIFINNAGLAIGKDFVGELKTEDIDKVLTTNLTSSIKLVNEVVKKMKVKQFGDVVNICSIAAHEAYAGGSIYCASKFGLRAYSDSLRKETHGQNIRVINISPGMVETEFSQVRFNDVEKAKAVYAGMTPLTADDIAYQILNALKSPRHVNIDEVIILATDQGSATTVKRKG